MTFLKKSVLALGFLFLPYLGGVPGQAQEPAVHAVLFYHPSCPHCHQVINETLVPLQNQYGKRLVILGMDTSQQWANNLYWEALRHYEVPEEDWVVPILVVGEEVLVGGVDIPGRLPTIIEEGLAAGGIDLPNFPAMLSFLQERMILDTRYPDRLIARNNPAREGGEPPVPADSVAADAPVPEGDTVVAADSVVPEPTPSEAPPPESPPAREDTARTIPEDPPEISGGDSVVAVPEEGRGGEPVVPDAEPAEGVGEEGEESIPDTPEVLPESRPETVGSLDLAEAARDLKSMTMWDRFAMDGTGNTISVLMLFVMIGSLLLRGYPPRVKGKEWRTWVIPALVLVGAGVAAYLSYIEVTHSEAVCGPVGDCNTVNQSAYATLFGFLPVGVLGLMGYGVILVLWVLGRSVSAGVRRMAILGLWGATLLGTLFSLYLTFLEPFVIGATCAWCLTSAAVMTLLLWASAPMAARVWVAGPAPSTSDD